MTEEQIYQTEEAKQGLIPKARYVNRRRMAWICLGIIITILTLIVFPIISVERISAIENIVVHVIWACFGVIGTYMGSTAVPDIVTKMKKIV